MHAASQWGSAFFDCLNLDLKAAFPGQSGFSVTNLKLTERWYSFYNQQITNQYQAGTDLSGQMATITTMPSDFGDVPWRHHVEIVRKCHSIEEALFYIEKTIENNWSRRQLEDYIAANLYANHGKAITNFSERLPTIQGKLAQELLKSPLNLEFLSMKQGYSEREFEDALCNNITRFLLELGKGFAFVGRQIELNMPGGQVFIPDLLFYHTKLKCYCVIELKVTDYIPEYAGKLNFYVTAVDNLMKGEDDRPTIGLLICRSADKTIVEWSITGISAPLGVATYQLQEVVDLTISQLAED